MRCLLLSRTELGLLDATSEPHALTTIVGGGIPQTPKIGYLLKQGSNGGMSKPVYSDNIVLTALNSGSGQASLYRCDSPSIYVEWRRGVYSIWAIRTPLASQAKGHGTKYLRVNRVVSFRTRIIAIRIGVPDRYSRSCSVQVGVEVQRHGP